MSFLATAELTFPGSRTEIEDSLASYLASLQKSGRIWGEAVWTWTAERALTVVCLVPLQDSLELRSSRGAEAADLERLESVLDGAVQWRLSGEASLARRTTLEWSRCAAFCLRTDLFDQTSPLVAGDSREPAPLYLLSLDENDQEECVFWMRAYQAHERIWLDSRDLESAAYFQLSHADSELSRRGQAICGRVERSTGVRTYYFLYRYYMVEPRLRDRCPVCKQLWVRPSAGELFEKYLVCDDCRLVSEEGVDASNLPEGAG